MSNFVDTPVKVNFRVRGIGGNVAATWKGTVLWKVEDDDGQVHEIRLPGTFYHSVSPAHAPDGKGQLPQKTGNLVRDLRGCEVFHNEGYQIQDEMADPISFAAFANFERQ
jgi:hypothetical protein